MIGMILISPFSEPLVLGFVGLQRVRSLTGSPFSLGRKCHHGDGKLQQHKLTLTLKDTMGLKICFHSLCVCMYVCSIKAITIIFLL